MNMHWIDWSILGALIAVLFGILFYCNKYVKNAADFLSASRCGGRYVLCISEGIAAIGAISIVAAFELYYKAGFVPIFWSWMQIPITLLMTMTAFVTYRFRETRCFTVAQLWELRYSKNFRIFAGILGWISGVLNYALFPAVSARFFMYFCGLGDKIHLGYVNISGEEVELYLGTYPTLLAIILFLGCFFAIKGGQVAIMVTDFFQGMFGNLAFLSILVFIFIKFDWTTITQALDSAPENKSLINPFNTGKVENFNYWYYIIAIFGAIYARGTWQGSRGYASAAKSPHEMRMAGLLGTWRGQAQTMVVFLLPIICYVVLHHANFAPLAGLINTEIGKIPDEQLQIQYTPIIALTKLLPIGLTGIFAAMMFAAMLSTDDTYLHSWGTIFIQDVLLPFRRKPFTPQQHIKYMQWSIVFVAVLAFFFSWYYRQTEHILLFFAITGAIFIGGAGAVMIGSLYWKKGTTEAAWCSMIIGSTLAVSGILLKQYPESLPVWLTTINEHGKTIFRWDGQWVYFFGMVTSAIIYIVVSLLTCKQDFNLDKLLHRGQYDTHGDHATKQKKIFDWKRLGVTDEFTFGDKCIYWATQSWSLFLFSIFACVYLYKFLVAMPSDDFWKTLWHCQIWLVFVLGCVTTVWFFIGGIKDIKGLFLALINLNRNDADDGRVVGDHSAGEYAGVESKVVRQARDGEERPKE